MEDSTPGAEVGAEAEGTEAVEDASAGSLQEALEALLSKSNLAHDQYLAGNMNAQMYIPISVLLAHEKLQGLGVTEGAVVAAAVKSTRLSVDDGRRMVRPLLKSKRNVIILRDMPPETTEVEVRELLAGAPHADRLVYVKPDVNNTWFVKFKLDDGTQDVVLWLREKTFKDQRVNAAIKSEHFLRSFFPLPLAGPVMPPQGPMGPIGVGTQMPPGYTGEMGAAVQPPAQWADAPPDGEPAPLGLGAAAGKGMLFGKGGPPMPQVGPQPPGFWQPWGARYQPPPLIFTSATTLASGSMPVVADQAAEMAPEILDNLADSEEGRGRWSKAKGRGKGKASDERGKGKAAASSSAAAHEPPARRKGHREEASGGSGGGSKWVPRSPPLVQEAQQASSGTATAAAAVYARDYRKYERADFMRIAKEMRGEKLQEPASIKLLGEEIPIFRESPSIELTAD